MLVLARALLSGETAAARNPFLPGFCCVVAHLCIALRQDRSVSRKLCHGWTLIDTDGMALFIRVFGVNPWFNSFGCGWLRWVIAELTDRVRVE
jgi:hypothetical protein